MSKRKDLILLIKFIETLRRKGKNISFISSNESIPLYIFEKYIDLLDWAKICKNKSIPVTFFEKNLEKIDWYEICRARTT